MSWFTSLFSSSKNSRNSRGVISSTHDAFSLPTSSPGHADAFNPDMLDAHDLQSASPSSYSYPPQSPTSGAYDYVPTATGSNSRKSTLLPLHNAMRANAPFPPLEQTWNRLRAWLASEYPELGDTLNYGILPQDLAQAEMTLGFALPQSVRDSYLCVDGQEPESAAGCSEGLFFGLTLLPLEDVMEEWKFWREVDEDPNTGANLRLKKLMSSIPSGWVRQEYSCRGWIPLVADKAGNYLGIDLNPGEGGSVGQVIVFGRDFDTKVVMYRGDGPHGWAKWLAGFVDDLESGEGFELGLNNDASSDASEDSVGYENYFFDGVGRGLGDGGGDIGSGGMRLTGEYKGWNVLEAWADRSVRKWQEAGVITTPASQPDKGKNQEQFPEEAVRFVSGANSGVEVPIPVLDNPGPSSSSQPRSHTTVDPDTDLSRPLPTISVTKPPAPLPVSLPTADDILVVNEPPPAVDDLEAGGNIAMREISPALPPTQPAVSSTFDASIAKLPPPPQSPTTPIPGSAAPILPKSNEVPDLLSDVPSEDSPVLVNVGADDGMVTEDPLSIDGELVSDAETDDGEVIPSVTDTKTDATAGAGEDRRQDSIDNAKDII